MKFTKSKCPYRICKMLFISNENRGQGIHIRCCICKKLEESSYEYKKRQTKDLSRIAEIFVFNNRINYLPIFKDESYSFGELQVVSFIEQYLKKERSIPEPLCI